MTIRADRALQSCDAIVGYGVYVDLVKERYPDKAFYETPMTQEAKRCALALELARAGKTAAMVCSGDSGIYGMAALVYELRGESEEPEIEVVPPQRRPRRPPQSFSPIISPRRASLRARRRCRRPSSPARRGNP